MINSFICLMVTLGTFLITCGKFKHFADENDTKIFFRDGWNILCYREWVLYTRFGTQSIFRSGAIICSKRFFQLTKYYNLNGNAQGCLSSSRGTWVRLSSPIPSNWNFRAWRSGPVHFVKLEIYNAESTLLKVLNLKWICRPVTQS